jgi:thymidylate synthase
MSDFICTNNVQYFIRDNKLITSVNMRSNDVVFGFNNDYAWQTHIRNKLHAALDVTYELGPIYWNVGSLHIYERHFNLIKEWEGKFDEDIKQQVEELQNYWDKERSKYGVQLEFNF